MDDTLKQETQALIRSWEQHSGDNLSDYLVEHEQDPRLNIQSILTRHFVLDELFPGEFVVLKNEELVFGAVVNWFVSLWKANDDPNLRERLAASLIMELDAPESIEIPAFVRETYSRLPAESDGMIIDNYIDGILTHQNEPGTLKIPEHILDTFRALWLKRLDGLSPTPISIVEPACGSANDYRFLHDFGIGRMIDYQGFDLCKKNIANAKGMFSGVAFSINNVFETQYEDKFFDFCIISDLFEHLSPQGLEAALAEVRRITRDKVHICFFDMEERDEHIIKPRADYYLNTLSRAKVEDIIRTHATDVAFNDVCALMKLHFAWDFPYNQRTFNACISV